MRPGRIAGDHMRRINLVDGAGELVAGGIVIDLPITLVVGLDDQVTLDSGTIGLDGDFAIPPA